MMVFWKNQALSLQLFHFSAIDEFDFHSLLEELSFLCNDDVTIITDVVAE